jgi:hypothetical protein
MNRDTLVKEWIRLRAELDTVERNIAATFASGNADRASKPEPLLDLFGSPGATSSRTPDLFVNTRLPQATKELILARLREEGRPMGSREIATRFRNNPRTPAAVLVHGILRGLVSSGLVKRSKGPNGVATFEVTNLKT